MFRHVFSLLLYIERRRNHKESDALSGAGAAGGGKELFNPAHALALFIIYTKRKREQLRRIIHPNCHNTNEQKWEILLLLIYSKEIIIIIKDVALVIIILKGEIQPH